MKRNEIAAKKQEDEPLPSPPDYVRQQSPPPSYLDAISDSNHRHYQSPYDPAVNSHQTPNNLPLTSYPPFNSVPKNPSNYPAYHGAPSVYPSTPGYNNPNTVSQPTSSGYQSNIIVTEGTCPNCQVSIGT